MLPFLGPVIAALGTAFNAVVAALPKIGAAIVSFIDKIPPQIREQILSVAIDVVADLSKRFLDVSDSPEKLGEKALNADKKPEDFDSITSYIKYLEKEIQIDPNVFINLTPEEKKARELAGTEIYRQGISEKLGFNMSDDFLILCGKAGLDAKTVYVILNALQENQSVTLDDFCKYFSGTIQPEKAKEIGAFCRSVFASVFNDLTSDSDINKKILSIMEDVRKV
jgi:hypothetical protein